MIATDVLWRLTAGQYGLCEEVIRPCRRGCDEEPDRERRTLSPILAKGRWYNRPGCGYGGKSCSCTRLCELILPGPVHDVIKVRQNGQVIPKSCYTLYRTPTAGRLVRTGDQCWPDCQDLRRPDTEPDTLSVRYLRGLPVPAAGQRAAGQLACEVYKQCTNTGGCALPAGTKTVVREGLTYNIVPPEGWAQTLQAHLPQVWAWVELVNPHRVQQFASVFSLDVPPAPVTARYRTEDQS